MVPVSASRADLVYQILNCCDKFLLIFVGNGVLIKGLMTRQKAQKSFQFLFFVLFLVFIADMAANLCLSNI